MAKTLIKTYSVPKEDIEVWNEFKELCREKRWSMSAEIIELIAMKVQATKEGKVMTYREKQHDL